MKTIVRNPDAVIILLIICGMLMTLTKHLYQIEGNAWIEFLYLLLLVEITHIVFDDIYVDWYTKAEAKFNIWK